MINKRIVLIICLLAFVTTLCAGCFFGPKAFLVNSVLYRFKAVGLVIESEEEIDPSFIQAKEAVRIKIDGGYLEIYEFDVDGSGGIMGSEAENLLLEITESQEYQGLSARVKRNVLIIGVEENPQSQLIENAILTLE